MDHPEFRRLGFDLSYLALLTESGLKRLSRWEGRLSPEQEQVLRDLGLEVIRVKRKLRFGRRAEEAVFSGRRHCTDLYRRRFHLTRIKESPLNMRLKGFLFGYPSCCVESFIRDGYARNGLSQEDQRILFHWACPGCHATPPLLKEYRAIHTECLKTFNCVKGHAGAVGPGTLRPSLLPGGLALALKRGAVPAALGLSAMLLLPNAGAAYEARQGMAAAGPFQDPHLLPVADDADTDYLSYGEEILRGLDALNGDTNENGVQSDRVPGSAYENRRHGRHNDECKDGNDAANTHTQDDGKTQRNVEHEVPLVEKADILNGVARKLARKLEEPPAVDRVQETYSRKNPAQPQQLDPRHGEEAPEQDFRDI